MKISTMGAELFRTDRHGDANSHFSQCCDTPKMGCLCVCVCVCVCPSHLNFHHWNESHETWYGHYGIRAHYNITLSNFLQSATVWRLHTTFWRQ